MVLKLTLISLSTTELDSHYQNHVFSKIDGGHLVSLELQCSSSSYAHPIVLFQQCSSGGGIAGVVTAVSIAHFLEGRKDVKIEDIQVRVCLFGFDLLYLNGEVRKHYVFLST